MNKNKLNSTVKTITDLLSQKAYWHLEKLSNGISLTAKELKQAVTDYGQTIIILPEQEYEDLDIIEVKDEEPKQWSVNVPVFTEEEGKSDLTLELTFIDTPTDLYKIEIDGLHVL